jgi:phospholipid N-methyltransferase
MEHRSSKLVRLYILQAVILITAFTLFFHSMEFYLHYSLLWAVIAFLSIAFLFKFLNLPFFIFPRVKGPVFVPSTDDDIQEMMTLLKVKHDEKAADLGAGDGRVVIALAEKAGQVHGFEINPDMLKKAEKNFEHHKIKNAKMYWQSFWDVDCSLYDVVTVYGFPSIMLELEKKLRAELKPGARVASNRYPFPHWRAEKHEGDVYLYHQK